jgi:hypothetical protein
MRGQLGHRVWPALVGTITLLVAVAGWALSSGLRETLRERTLDYLLPLLNSPIPAGQVVVVDINHATLESVGPWPWPRTRLARLLAAVAANKPVVIGLDVLGSAKTDNIYHAGWAWAGGAVPCSSPRTSAANHWPCAGRQGQGRCALAKPRVFVKPRKISVSAGLRGGYVDSNAAIAKFKLGHS